MDDKSKGLYKKYEVSRVDGKPVNWGFVLEDKDPRAIPALEAYSKAARESGYVALANDLDFILVQMKGIQKGT